MKKNLRNLGFILCGVLVFCFLVYKFLPQSTVNMKPEEQKQTYIQAFSTIGNLAASHSYSSGPLDAKVTIVEFFDPECESCAAVAPLIKNEMKYYEGKVRWVFRYMTYHYNSKTAAMALEAARNQNLFLEAKDLLFETQKIWGEQRISTEQDILKILSKIKKLNMNQLRKDMNAVAIQENIEKDTIEGKQAGVNGTPTFFINGVMMDSPDMDAIIKRINELL